MIINKGDRVRITQHNKTRPTETFEAHVGWDVEDRGDYLSVGFIPVVKGSNEWDHNHGVVGTIRVYKTGVVAPPFVATVEVIPRIPVHTGTSLKPRLQDRPLIHQLGPAKS